MNEKELFKAQIRLWKDSPSTFAKDVFGFVPDKQQAQLFEEVAKIYKAKIKVKYQDQMSPEDQIYAQKRGISVMSGKGTGKTTILAILAFWFLMLNKEAKIPVTGPSYDQIRDIFMSEMYKWHARCKLKDWVEMQSDTIFAKEGGEIIKHWYLKLRTASRSSTPEQQGNTLAGWHENFMMVIADEASDVPDPVFSKFDTTLTKPVNFVLLAFNPTRTTGFAYNTQFQDTHDKWIKLHWNAYDSEHVTPQQLIDMKQTYGEGSNEYRISVLGLPPLAEKDALIPMDWINAAVDRYDQANPTNEQIVAGIDIAREGVDKTSVIFKQSSRVIKIVRYNEPDSMKNADKIIELLREYKAQQAAIDAIGVGGPVYDYLRRFYANIRPVDVHKIPVNSERFPLLRDELWWSMRELFQNGLIDIPNDRELINELSNIRYGTDTKGRIKVESKKEIKGRGCPSPDSADAILITQTLKNILTKYTDYAYSESVVKKPHSWMGV